MSYFAVLLSEMSICWLKIPGLEKGDYFKICYQTDPIQEIKICVIHI